GPCSLALEQRVRRDGRAVREALDVLGADRACRGLDGLLLARRGRHFCGPRLAVDEEDGVGERAADVDAQDAQRRAASADAFMCPTAAIVTIGFTPDAVGNAEPSHTTRR